MPPINRAAFFVVKIMQKTLEDILKQVGVNVNGVAEVPSGDELTAWIERVNEAYFEWSNSYDPQILIETYRTTMAQSSTSVSLPISFKKFAGFVKADSDNIPELDPVEATTSTGDYITWGGNARDGYYLNISEPVTEDVPFTVPYHSRPTSLSTLTSIAIIPDPEFLTARTTEKVMLQRSQPEYVEFQVKADLLLQRMVAEEVSTDIQKSKGIRTQDEYNGFTFGED